MASRLQMWGGVECTFNRVQDSYLDQLAQNGHEERIDDLDLFAEFGLRTLRSPFLWEKIAPDAGSTRWDWAAARLARLDALGIAPIAGLVHHGSGPPATSLLDPEFGSKLAAYAGEFARRFPNVTCYTPVNEPTTTARFSALYGLWYPHATDELSFFRALLNQCKGTVLAMQAIRESNPAAVLVQTEDMGRVQSTPRLAAQRDYENTRRWLTFDILCGRVNREHPLWQGMLTIGLTEKEIRWFEEHPCPPAIVGLNHYTLSNRYLDEKLERYPARYHGGNGRERYADVEAVRVAGVRTVPLDDILVEAWERYGIPVAITEAHIDCTREEQMRWLVHFWNMAHSARNRGADVRAVTAWGLLGHYDWHCLVTRCEGYYEPGAFDMRGGRPRPTALAGVIKALATDGTAEHPVLEVPGWWERDVRISYPSPVAPPEPGRPGSFGRREEVALMTSGPAVRRTAPLLITGATGTLGRAFARVCELRGIPYVAMTRSDLDIVDEGQVVDAISQLKPWAVVNAAGYVRVDDAEADRERCFRENLDGAVNIARVCARHNIHSVAFSSDLVFDGRSRAPYREGSAVAPLNVYGESKARAEQQIMEAAPGALVIRTSTFFGPWDEANFLTRSLRCLRSGKTLVVPQEGTFSPTYVPDLVDVSLDLLLDGADKIWHLANVGETNWIEFARAAAKAAALDSRNIRGVSVQELSRPAARPSYSVLGTERGVFLPSLDDALGRYFWAMEKG